jgi:peptide deformylase
MLKLIKDPDPILKQKAEPWDFQNHVNAQEVEREMLQIMYASNGRGLAGNQVGLLRRVFVMITTDGRSFGVFNPSILHAEETIIGEEGCLSFPDLWLDVPRYKKITAMYLDNTGEKRIIELEGIDARCFQHELDHLDGVCFTDNISTLKLAMARKRQQKRKRNGRTK